MSVPESAVGVKPSGSCNPSRSAADELADALFTKTQQRVLGVLFGQPERSFYGDPRGLRVGGMQSRLSSAGNTAADG
jgi:hypothetical protein